MAKTPFPSSSKKVADALRKRILSGTCEIKPIPSERQLAEAFGLHDMTVRRGLHRGRPLHVPPASYRRAFSLIEVMLVIAIIVTLTALVVPSVSGSKNVGDITKATYDVAGVLEHARAYATANNTYVWVGFYEEDASKRSTAPTATSGTGRIVLSTVASKDGMPSIDSKMNSVTTPCGNLVQINKLVKIENAHLKTASAGDSIFPIGDGTGESFLTRPPTRSSAAQIGDSSPNAALTSFRYPLSATTPQYTFQKLIQFSPRGEVAVNSTYSTKPIVEVGLQPTQGTTVNATNANVAAIQITGILGNVKIYRR